MPDPVLDYRLAEAVDGDGLYLECPPCEDIVVPIEAGNALGGLLQAAHEHHNLYHQED